MKYRPIGMIWNKFLARNSKYAVRETCYRLSVRLSFTRVNQSKRLNIGLCSFQYSPIPLVSARYVSSRNSNGLYNKSVCFPSAGRQPSNKSGWVVGKSSVNASKKYKIRLKLLLMTNRKLHVRCAFDCYQDRWPYMTLNCYKFDFLRISRDFVDLGFDNN